MGVYTHIGLHDQTTAIERLPAPPELTAQPFGKPIAADVVDAASAKKKSSNGHDSHTAKVQLSSDLSQLDSVWNTLPDNIKAGILALANVAIVPQQDSVSSK
jgi:hypothetical protein